MDQFYLCICKFHCICKEIKSLQRIFTGIYSYDTELETLEFAMNIIELMEVLEIILTEQTYDQMT